MRRVAAGAFVGGLAAALLQLGTPAVEPQAAPQPRRIAPAQAAPTPLDPEMYTAGGCVAFAPTSGSRHRTVFLDPGHGGIDPGSIGVTTSGQQVSEAELTLPVALKAADALRARGYRVVLYRTTDTLGVRLDDDAFAEGALTLDGQRLALNARTHCANIGEADALVSIHFNSFSDPEVRAAQTLWENGRPFAAKNAQLATLLQQHIVRGFRKAGRPVPNGGTQTTAEGELPLVMLGAAYGEVITAPSMMPGALIEPLYLSNPGDATLAASPKGQRALAHAITLAVEDFLQQRGRP